MRFGAWLLFATIAAQAQQAPDGQWAVRGRVVNAANGEPVARARLMLRHTDNPEGGSGQQGAYKTLTDARGRFAMNGIEPGKYNFSATRGGFAESFYGARRPGHIGITISLEAGQQMSGVVFRMTPQAVIAGRILDADGDPVQDAQVNTMRYRYIMGKRQLVPMGRASTDDLGEYRLFGLAPGRYYIKATYQGFGMRMQTAQSAKAVEDSFVPTYFPGTTDIGTAKLLELAAGTQMRGMDFTLSKEHSVHVRGRVTAPEGTAVSAGMVTLVPQRGFSYERMHRTRVMDAQGTFDISGVSPGSYTLNASLRIGENDLAARQKIEVGTGNVENLVLTLTPGFELAGQVRFEGQRPARITEIQINLGTPDPSELRIGFPSGELKDDGSFSVSHVWGELYRVQVAGLPEGYYLTSVHIGDDELKEAEIDATRGAPGPLLLTISANAGQVEGIVRNAKDHPVPGAAVVLVPEPKKRSRAEAFHEVKADQYGRYAFRTIEPGEYKLFAWDDVDGGEYIDPEFLKPVEDRGYAVSIREGSREKADLKLIRAAVR